MEIIKSHNKTLKNLSVYFSTNQSQLATALIKSLEIPIVINLKDLVLNENVNTEIALIFGPGAKHIRNFELNLLGRYHIFFSSLEQGRKF